MTENVETIGAQLLVARAVANFECREADAGQSVEETNPAELTSSRDGVARSTEGNLREIVALESGGY